jgi:hypothetical protein
MDGRNIKSLYCGSVIRTTTPPTWSSGGRLSEISCVMCPQGLKQNDFFPCARPLRLARLSKSHRVHQPPSLGRPRNLLRWFPPRKETAPIQNAVARVGGALLSRNQWSPAREGPPRRLRQGKSFRFAQEMELFLVQPTRVWPGYIVGAHWSRVHATAMNQAVRA